MEAAASIGSADALAVRRERGMLADAGHDQALQNLAQLLRIQTLEQPVQGRFGNRLVFPGLRIPSGTEGFEFVPGQRGRELRHVQRTAEPRQLREQERCVGTGQGMLAALATTEIPHLFQMRMQTPQLCSRMAADPAFPVPSGVQLPFPAQQPARVTAQGPDQNPLRFIMLPGILAGLARIPGRHAQRLPASGLVHDALMLPGATKFAASSRPWP